MTERPQDRTQLPDPRHDAARGGPVRLRNPVHRNLRGAQRFPPDARRTT
ncbi:hypothetical protein [Actinoplanes sp. N902-109]|nr:hypothetical protein [Actinoplanes sp. N902-109]AGL16922.1 hypothetical protein L083_3412 [Actinoplanes sp. N902-109]